MISAKEARKLSEQNNYENRFREHIRSINEDIRRHAENRFISYHIFDKNLEYMTITLIGTLKEFGYQVNLVEKGMNYNKIEIYW